MSFSACNANTADSQIALQQSLQYAELCSEYTQVLNMCRQNNLQDAWKILNGLLDGDLFGEGPSFTYLPAIRDLQKSVLAMAIDVAKVVDKEYLSGLLLEAVEWFPLESAFWTNLASVMEGSFEKAVVRKLALEKAVTLDPFSKELKQSILNVKCSIGIPSAANMSITKRLFEPQVPSTVQEYSLEVSSSLKLSVFFQKICDLLDDIFNINPKRNRSNSDKVRYCAPLRIIFKDENEIESLANEDASLLLSQTTSIKNLQEYSQVSTRSQSRKLRNRDTPNGVKGESRMSLKEFYEKFYGILENLPIDQEIAEHFEKINAARNSQSSDMDCFVPFDTDSFYDPSWTVLNMEFNENVTTVKALILHLGNFISSKSFGSLSWMPDLQTSITKFVEIILQHLEVFIDDASDDLLLFLAEYASESISSLSDSLTSLIKALSFRLVQPCISHESLIRYLWLKYREENKNEKTLTQLESLFLTMRDTSFSLILRGTFQNNRRLIISRKALRSIRDNIEKHKLFEQVENTLNSEFNVRSTIEDPIIFLLNNINEPNLAQIAMNISQLTNDTGVKTLCLVILLSSYKDIDHEKISADFSITDMPKIWTAAARNHKELFERVFSLQSPIDQALVVLSVLKEYNILPDNNEILALFWRDFLIPEKLHCKDSRFVTALSDELDHLDVFLAFSTLKVKGGLPAIPYDDPWGLALALGDDSISNGNLTIKEATFIYKHILHLKDDLTILPSTLFNFIDKLAEYLKPQILQLTTFKFEQKRFEKYLESPPTPVLFKKRTFRDKQGVATLLCDLLAWKRELHGKLPLKKKHADNFGAMREEMKILYLLKEDSFDSLNSLGSLYDSELRVWCLKDASTILPNSNCICKFILDAANALRLAVLHSKGESISSAIIEYGRLIKSIIEGVLSMLVPEKIDFKFLATELYSYILEKGDFTNLDILLLQYDLGRHLGRIDNYRIVFTALEIYFKKELDNGEKLYLILCNCFREVLDGNADKLDSLLSIIKSSSHLKDLFEITDDDEEIGFKDILPFVKHLSKLDKKRMHHEHIYMLAEYGSISLEDVKANWSKLIPVLVKPKSSQLVNVWQNDNTDYPGDYLYYSEKYILSCCKAISISKGDPLERASLVAMLLGRVASAHNICIRRRKVVLQCLEDLSDIVESTLKSVEQDSLADFQNQEDRNAELVGILADAVTLSQSLEISLISDRIKSLISQ